MADNSVQLKFVIDAVNRTDAAFKAVEDKLDSVKKRMENLTPTFERMQRIGTVAFVAVAAEATLAVKAFAESQEQMTRVDAVIDTFSKETLAGLGGTVESARARVREFGREMQSLGGISDEVASEGLAKLTQQTGDVAKATDAARLAADFAKYRNIDYGTSVDIVSKVLAGNVSILTRYGIQLKEGATAEEALGVMAEKSAGQYERYGKTVAGQMAILKETFGDMQENIGQALIPVMTKLFQTIQPIIEKMVEWTSKNPDLTAKILLVSGAVALLVAGLGTLGLAVPVIIAGFTLMTGPIGIVAGIIAGLTLTINNVVTIYDTLKNHSDEVWDGMKIIAGEALDWIKEKVQALINLVDQLKNKLSGATATVGTAWRNLPANLGIPGFAGGGMVPGPEGRPTLAVVHGGERVLTADEAKGGRGNVFNFTFNGDVNDKDALCREVIDVINRKSALVKQGAQ